MKGTTTTISKREIPIPPMSRSDIAFNAIRLVLNGGWTLWGMDWLVMHWTTMCPPWYVFALTIFVGLFISEFFSGLLHWAFDTWFTEDTPFLRRMVLIVREHHVHPQHIFRYKFHYEAGSVSWPSLAHTIPVIGLVTLTPGLASVFCYCTVIVSVMVSILTLFMLQFHKLGHRRSDSIIVRCLQRTYLHDVSTAPRATSSWKLRHKVLPHQRLGRCCNGCHWILEGCGMCNPLAYGGCAP